MQKVLVGKETLAVKLLTASTYLLTCRSSDLIFSRASRTLRGAT